MQNVANNKLDDFTPLSLQQSSYAPCIGKVVEITKAKEVMVDYVGNKYGPLIARITSTAFPYSVNSNINDASVLLLFENGNLRLPIIIGVIKENLDNDENNVEALLQERRPSEGLIDGEVLIFDANYEIILRCGKSSITLTKDGKIVLKGTKVVSRSSGENKIKGTSVSIN